jgi:hypothetical protein
MSDASIIEKPVATRSPVPRAVIPPLPVFELTPPAERPPSREDFLIAELERRFGGRAIWSGPSKEKPGFEPKPERERVADPPLEEPEWTGGFRGCVGKLLWERGLKQKAIRFFDCNKLGRPGVCSNYPLEHKFFVPHGCEVIFCKECAAELRRELFIAYWHVICNAVLDFAGERAEHERLCALLHESDGRQRQDAERQLGELWARVGRKVRKDGWVLARVTFTLRSDGRDITPGRVKAGNACVGAVMRRTVGSLSGFGMLYVDEVGFEKRGHLPDAQRIAHGLNLHVHGLYFGPRVHWERTRDLWMEVTKKKFGVESRGFYITAAKGFVQNPGRAIRWALHHMLKYVSKPPAVTPERLASLIAAFDGAKRAFARPFLWQETEARKEGLPLP